jgi:glutaconyl-CoA/methylmalonyl-CoA decarboxylase subunit gamma
MKTYRIRIEGQPYEVIVSALDTNPVQVTVNGEAFEVWLDNGQSKTQVGVPTLPAMSPTSTPRPAISLPSPTTGDEHSRQVKAPIPGVITQVHVKPGQDVQSGEPLCNLEAMKMNNTIRAARSGKIATVFVSMGQHVKHQEVLVEFVG